MKGARCALHWIIRTCKVFHSRLDLLPAQRIFSHTAAPHDHIEGTFARFSPRDYESKVWRALLRINITNEERNITLLLIQHSDVLTFKSTVPLHFYLGFICYTFLLGAERTFKHTAEKNAERWTHFSFPACFFPWASTRMILSEGHSSQKQTISNGASLFLKKNKNPNKSLAEETKQDTFWTGKTWVYTDRVLIFLKIESQDCDTRSCRACTFHLKTFFAVTYCIITVFIIDSETAFSSNVDGNNLQLALDWLNKVHMAVKESNMSLLLALRCAPRGFSTRLWQHPQQ